MSAEAQELLRICELLTEQKRRELADFGRFLLTREGDLRWEEIINNPNPLPKFEEFARESAKEPATPFNIEQL